MLTEAHLAKLAAGRRARADENRARDIDAIERYGRWVKRESRDYARLLAARAAGEGISEAERNWRDALKQKPANLPNDQMWRRLTGTED